MLRKATFYKTFSQESLQQLLRYQVFKAFTITELFLDAKYLL